MPVFLHTPIVSQTAFTVS